MADLAPSDRLTAVVKQNEGRERDKVMVEFMGNCLYVCFSVRGCV